MKDQYFGDVNDFRKYGLLRLLTAPDLQLGVCWMLTAHDGGTDGEMRAYLDQPNEFRSCDTELFDWLKQVVGVERDRRTARIEASSLLGSSAVFKSELLGNHDLKERASYFSDCTARFTACDLVFFDPDNGMEIVSKKRGSLNSSKFLHWDELLPVYNAGASVLVYQHFIREARDGFTQRMAAELERRTKAAAVFSYRTPHVVFLLAAQPRHASGFRNQMTTIRSRWSPSQITATEHTTTPVV